MFRVAFNGRKVFIVLSVLLMKTIMWVCTDLGCFLEKYRIPPVLSFCTRAMVTVTECIWQLQPHQLSIFLCSQSQRETEMPSSASLLLIVQSVKTLLSGAFDALLLF